jgi:hypothetical protein
MSVCYISRCVVVTLISGVFLLYIALCCLYVNSLCLSVVGRVVGSVGFHGITAGIADVSVFNVPANCVAAPLVVSI